MPQRSQLTRKELDKINQPAPNAYKTEKYKTIDSPTKGASPAFAYEKERDYQR